VISESHPVAFIATANTELSRAFYEGSLGLKLLADDGFALVFELHGGGRLRVVRVQEVVVAPYTVLGWDVDDIEAEMERLVAEGIVFQRYEGFEQDDAGVWTVAGAKVAWFKDPDGHTLSLTQHT
jgi:catechol 2,3-dioxygenase-like lactoylglutathione lyase family enzyme